MSMLQNDIYIGSLEDPLYHIVQNEVREEAPRGVFSLDLIGKI